MRWMYREEEARGGRTQLVAVMDTLAELRKGLLADG